MTAPTDSRDRRPRRTARRRVVDTRRRDELLRQAEAIILAEGFTAVTMDELAQRLGCSKATLYSLASTKEQLVLAVTRTFFREATAGPEARRLRRQRLGRGLRLGARCLAGPAGGSGLAQQGDQLVPGQAQHLGGRVGSSSGNRPRHRQQTACGGVVLVDRYRIDPQPATGFRLERKQTSCRRRRTRCAPRSHQDRWRAPAQQARERVRQKIADPTRTSGLTPQEWTQL